ncbi:MAG: methyltransferase domain-containing protein [Candidatus Puniceispirillaceae bacterium]
MLNFIKKKLRHIRFLRLFYWKIRNNNPILRLKKSLIIRRFNEDRFFLNVGGFIFLKDDWRVLDYISKAYPISEKLIDYNINLSEKQTLPIADKKADLVYSSHTFEHILEDAALFHFGEIHRILKREGTFRIVVPDIDLFWDACKRNDTDFLNHVSKGQDESLPSFFLNSFSCMRAEKETLESDFNHLTKEDFLQRYQTKQIENPANHDFSHHINWFTYDKLRSMLIKAGFDKDKIIRSDYLDSRSLEMRDERFFDQTIPKASLFVECVK